MSCNDSGFHVENLIAGLPLCSIPHWDNVTTLVHIAAQSWMTFFLGCSFSVKVVQVVRAAVVRGTAECSCNAVRTICSLIYFSKTIQVVQTLRQPCTVAACFAALAAGRCTRLRCRAVEAKWILRIQTDLSVPNGAQGKLISLYTDFITDCSI